METSCITQIRPAEKLINTHSTHRLANLTMLNFSLKTQQPSCVAFAGQDLNLLCVTTARQDLDASALAKDTQAGNLFIFETDFQGLKETAFAG